MKLVVEGFSERFILDPQLPFIVVPNYLLMRNVRALYRLLGGSWIGTSPIAFKLESLGRRASTLEGFYGLRLHQDPPSTLQRA